MDAHPLRRPTTTNPACLQRPAEFNMYSPDELDAHAMAFKRSPKLPESNTGLGESCDDQQPLSVSPQSKPKRYLADHASSTYTPPSSAPCTPLKTVSHNAATNANANANVHIALPLTPSPTPQHKIQLPARKRRFSTGAADDEGHHRRNNDDDADAEDAGGQDYGSSNRKRVKRVLFACSTPASRSHAWTTLSNTKKPTKAAPTSQSTRLFKNTPRFSIVSPPAIKAPKHEPVVSAAELKRVAECVLRQVDWDNVAGYVASNRRGGVYKQALKAVLEGRIEELLLLEEQEEYEEEEKEESKGGKGGGVL
ncbi:MAG: hypothetical protein M1819_004021 [Sarea resinae]|nr:MAG: hypothetical protein M1819_004021 [Sarea resinae]